MKHCHSESGRRGSKMVEPNSTLTQREKEVLTLLVRAFSNKEIATKMTISPSTVKRHVENIFRKLGVKNRVAAAVHAAHSQAGTSEGSKAYPRIR